MKIGSFETKNDIFLAPMAGVSDSAMRIICAHMGAGLCFSEMVSARALCRDDKKTRELIYKDKLEGDLVVQLFGSEPESMAVAAKKVQATGDFCAIDINMGCPTPKIVRNGDGSALMRDAELAKKIVGAVVDAVSLPVTVKMRTGWDEKSINARQISLAVVEAGASCVTVHGRTTRQGYAPYAEYDTVKEVKSSVGVPVVVSGDIDSREKYDEVKAYTMCDGYMIGRAAMGDPFIFRRIVSGGSGAGADEKADIILWHYELMSRQKGGYRAAREMRKHLLWYLKGFPSCRDLKLRASAVESGDDIRGIAEEIRSRYR